jgi:hypothetical protein
MRVSIFRRIELMESWYELIALQVYGAVELIIDSMALCVS